MDTEVLHSSSQNSGLPKHKNGEPMVHRDLNIDYSCFAVYNSNPPFELDTEFFQFIIVKHR